MGSWRWIVIIGVIGFAAALSAEVAAAVLLYAESGFLRAATLVFAVEAAAFGTGLLVAAFRSSEGGLTINRARGWWFLTMLTFSLTTAFTGAWTMGGAPPSQMTQGLGLAVLAALPLFASGGLFAVVTSSALSDADRAVGGPVRPVRGKTNRLPASLAAAGWFGAVVGMGVGGVMLSRVPPFSILLLCMVALALGALHHGRALETRPFIEPLDIDEGNRVVDDDPFGTYDHADAVDSVHRADRADAGTTRYRVEHWSAARNGVRRIAVIREARRMVTWDPQALGGSDWQSVARAVVRDRWQGDMPPKILLIGADSFLTFPGLRSTLDQPAAEVTIVEPDAELLRLVRKYVDGPNPQSESVTVLSELDESFAGFDLVVVGHGPRSGDNGASRDDGAAGDTPYWRVIRPTGAIVLLGRSVPPTGPPDPWMWWSYHPEEVGEAPFARLGEEDLAPFLLGAFERSDGLMDAPEITGFSRIRLSATGSL